MFHQQLHVCISAKWLGVDGHLCRRSDQESLVDPDFFSRQCTEIDDAGHSAPRLFTYHTAHESFAEFLACFLSQMNLRIRRNSKGTSPSNLPVLGPAFVLWPMAWKLRTSPTESCCINHGLRQLYEMRFKTASFVLLGMVMVIWQCQMWAIVIEPSWTPKSTNRNMREQKWYVYSMYMYNWFE